MTDTLAQHAHGILNGTASERKTYFFRTADATKHFQVVVHPAWQTPMITIVEAEIPASEFTGKNQIMLKHWCYVKREAEILKVELIDVNNVAVR